MRLFLGTLIRVNTAPDSGEIVPEYVTGTFSIHPWVGSEFMLVWTGPKGPRIRTTSRVISTNTTRIKGQYPYSVTFTTVTGSEYELVVTGERYTNEEARA